MSPRQRAWVLSAPALLLVIVFLGLPVLSTLATTFGDPKGPFHQYAAFFDSKLRMRVLWRTLEVALVTTAVSLFVGFVTAWVVSKAPARIKSLLIIAAVFPLLTGVVVRSFAWLVILGKNGIVNETLLRLHLISEPLNMLYTQFSVTIAMIYLFVPLMILTLVGVLEGIPQDLTDAAASLGAKPAAAFRQVVLPMAVPGLIVGSVLVFTGSFTSYATPQLLGGERQMMMGTFLYQRAMVTFDWVGASTIAAVMVVVTLVTVLIMSKLAQRLNPVAG
ncbi:ABC transporter permease [Pseudooceanicola sp. CBS1P-1]|uniref:ABC transporter permease subunit n=1 Tax=Pseudooceanicola albus TaxID=2692189 RepID=A0A6L7G0Z9_9RHOB|nr:MULTISPECIES: ABC transporter permease [Pseudooceanicola]MBT9384992.1 ABC transporter permease [Pseudooceanicola endophyticus]MXN18014.1 ABC transporter permease subunit [Pseudooceanicola albus]